MNSGNEEIAQIFSSEAFIKLVKVRSTVRWTLSFLVLALHLFFIGGIAFYTQWFGQPIYEKSSIPIGIVCTVIVIVLMVFLEFVYIKLSEAVLDPLQKKAALGALPNE